MKRYFTSAVQPGQSSFHCDSVYHWMSLPGGGYVIVMIDGEFDPDPEWAELPHLLDSSSANFDGIQSSLGTSGTPTVGTAPSVQTVTVTTPAASATVHSLATPAPSATVSSPHAPIAGVSLTDSTFQVAKKLAAINRHFHP